MIVEMQVKTFINMYGYSERYVSKEINMELSGHMNIRSEYSSSDSCGNCDGARCDSCHKIYKVCMYDEPVYNESEGYMEIKIRTSKIFDTLDEALEFYNNNL